MHTELKAYYDSKSKRPQEIMEDSVNHLTEPVFPRESKLFPSGETHRALLPQGISIAFLQNVVI